MSARSTAAEAFKISMSARNEFLQGGLQDKTIFLTFYFNN